MEAAFSVVNLMQVVWWELRESGCDVFWRRSSAAVIIGVFLASLIRQPRQVRLALLVYWAGLIYCHLDRRSDDDRGLH